MVPVLCTNPSNSFPTSPSDAQKADKAQVAFGGSHRMPPSVQPSPDSPPSNAPVLTSPKPSGLMAFHQPGQHLPPSGHFLVLHSFQLFTQTASIGWHLLKPPNLFIFYLFIAYRCIGDEHVVLDSSAHQGDSVMHIHGSILYQILFPFRLSSIIWNSASLAQTVKKLPAMQETWVRSLVWEDPLEKERPPTPVFLLGESHGQRSLIGYSPWGRKELDVTEQLTENHKTLHSWGFLPPLLSLSPWHSNHLTW